MIVLSYDVFLYVYAPHMYVKDGLIELLKSMCNFLPLSVGPSILCVFCFAVEGKLNEGA